MFLRKPLAYSLSNIIVFIFNVTLNTPIVPCLTHLLRLATFMAFILHSCGATLMAQCKLAGWSESDLFVYTCCTQTYIKEYGG